VVGHVEAGHGPRGAQVGVHGEEQSAQVGRRLEIAQDVVEEVVRVVVARVAGAFVFGLVVAAAVRGAALDGVRLPVVEDDDFVDAEDGGCAGDLGG